jgi:hypothetical protein
MICLCYSVEMIYFEWSYSLLQYMSIFLHRASFRRNRSVPSQPLHRPAAISVHCTKSWITVKICSWVWSRLSAETCRSDLQRSINERSGVPQPGWTLPYPPEFRTCSSRISGNTRHRLSRRARLHILRWCEAAVCQGFPSLWDMTSCHRILCY